MPAFARLFSRETHAFSRETHAAEVRFPRHSHRLKVVSTAAASAVLVVGVAAGCSSGGGGGGSSADSPVVICEDAAQSGPFAALGTNDGYGATAWANMVNKSGGLLGHQVKIVIENNASDPATAASAARKCVTQDHANFIFGPENSATVTAAIPVSNQLQTILLGWSSGWDNQGVSNANLHSYAFPGIGNVFFADDQEMITQIIVPRHYTRVAVIDENTPGGLSNLPYMKSLQSKYGYQVVSSQIINPGSTNDTPQVLNLLKGNPQVIVLGLTPGPDTITFLKTMRAQSPTIPIGECSACTTTQFIDAVGGASAMQDIYLIGTPDNALTAFANSSANAAALTDTRAYIAAMKAAGEGSTTLIDEGSEGWDTGQELAAAIKSANSISESAVKNALEHQKLATGGEDLYEWTRTPQDYSTMSSALAAMDTVAPNGALTVVPYVGS
ncbi:MAG TPA: ABC transporter substrate-binding protein [Trebonia sp.]|jgi:branched-chain amino acid transport system substrate-binding protein